MKSEETKQIVDDESTHTDNESLFSDLSEHFVKGTELDSEYEFRTIDEIVAEFENWYDANHYINDDAVTSKDNLIRIIRYSYNNFCELNYIQNFLSMIMEGFSGLFSRLESNQPLTNKFGHALFNACISGIISSFRTNSYVTNYTFMAINVSNLFSIFKNIPSSNYTNSLVMKLFLEFLENIDATPRAHEVNNSLFNFFLRLENFENASSPFYHDIVILLEAKKPAFTDFFFAEVVETRFQVSLEEISSPSQYDKNYEIVFASKFIDNFVGVTDVGTIRLSSRYHRLKHKFESLDLSNQFDNFVINELATAIIYDACNWNSSSLAKYLDLTDSARFEFADEFLEYFCLINQKHYNILGIFLAKSSASAEKYSSETEDEKHQRANSTYLFIKSFLINTLNINLDDKAKLIIIANKSLITNDGFEQLSDSFESKFRALSPEQAQAELDKLTDVIIEPSELGQLNFNNNSMPQTNSSNEFTDQYLIELGEQLSPLVTAKQLLEDIKTAYEVVFNPQRSAEENREAFDAMTDNLAMVDDLERLLATTPDLIKHPELELFHNPVVLDIAHRVATKVDAVRTRPGPINIARTLAQIPFSIGNIALGLMKRELLPWVAPKPIYFERYLIEQFFNHLENKLKTFFGDLNEILAHDVSIEAEVLAALLNKPAFLSKLDRETDPNIILLIPIRAEFNASSMKIMSMYPKTLNWPDYHRRNKTILNTPFPLALMGNNTELALHIFKQQIALGKSDDDLIDEMNIASYEARIHRKYEAILALLTDPEVGLRFKQLILHEKSKFQTNFAVSLNLEHDDGLQRNINLSDHLAIYSQILEQLKSIENFKWTLGSMRLIETVRNDPDYKPVVELARTIPLEGPEMTAKRIARAREASSTEHYKLSADVSYVFRLNEPPSKQNLK